MSFFQSSKSRPTPGHRPPDVREGSRQRPDTEDDNDEPIAHRRAGESPDEKDSSSSRESRGRNDDDEHREGPHRDRQSTPRMPGSRAAKMAMQHLLALTGQQPESLSGLTPSEGGWKVTLDVVELERIPRTTDVMASYEIELDEEGELVGYRRLGRYYRNQVDER